MHAHVQTSLASLWEGLACETSVGGNSLVVAFIDTESLAIAILWRLSTLTVGVNSLGLNILPRKYFKAQRVGVVWTEFVTTSIIFVTTSQSGKEKWILKAWPLGGGGGAMLKGLGRTLLEELQCMLYNSSSELISYLV
jgi:hypothetical protein